MQDQQLLENADWTFGDLDKLKIKIRKKDAEFRVVYDLRFNSFWANGFEKNWEPFTFEVFDTFIDPQKVYIDFGAWIGPTVLYAATKAKHVYGLEPDRVAFQILERNISANPDLMNKITVHDHAVSVAAGPLTLFCSEAGGDSCSSVIAAGKGVSYAVKGLTISEFFKENKIDPTEIGFIKIDIEGAEFDIIKSLMTFLKDADIRPVLYISTHRPYVKKMLKHRYRWLGPLKNLAARAATWEKVKNFVAELDIYPYHYDSSGNLIGDLYSWARPKGYQAILLTNQEWKR